MYHQSEQEFKCVRDLCNSYKKVSCFTDIYVDPEGFKVSSTELIYNLASIYLVTILIERDARFDYAAYILKSIKEDENRRIAQSHLEHCWGWLYLRRSVLEGSPQNAQKTQKILFDKLDFIKHIRLDEVSIVGGEISSEISWNDGFIWLENAIISNSNPRRGLKVNGIYLAESIIEYILIKKARVKEMEFCPIENGDYIPELYTHFLGFSAGELSHLALNPRRVVLADVELKSPTIRSVEILTILTLDLAIEHLQKSLDYCANPYAYLHLAQAYELQMEREKDEAKKAHLKQKALNACQHAIELDRLKEHAAHTEDLKKRLGESPTAIGPAPKKEEKEGKATVKETGTSGSSSDADKKNR